MKRYRLQPKDYTVGWVCALPIELAAAKVILDEDHEDLPQDDPNDTNLYTLGRIGDHNVVIACLPAGQTGNNNATAVAVLMKSKFKSVQFSLMVGIGGGVPSGNADVRLGDVVISQPDKQHGGVVQYDIGKTTPNGFQRTGSLNTPPTVLLKALSMLQANRLLGKCNLAQHLSLFSALPSFARDNAGADVLFEPTYKHVGGEKCEMCSQRRRIKRNLRGSQEIAVHCGTIASGNQVMRDGATRDRVSSELGGVLCFEMEAAGLMNNFPCLVIRGICDYADSHKNKMWQHYAAATAVACAKEVLSVIPAKEAINSLTLEMLLSVIDTVDLDLIFKTLSVIDQKHISAAPPLEGDQPMFSWIFGNVDFKQWSSASSSQLLWLSAPPERSIQRVSSHIVSQEKTKALKTQHFVLYFFCSTAVGGKPIVPVFVHTLLDQIIRSSSPTDGISIARRFLYSLTEGIFKEEAAPRREEWDLGGEDSNATIRKILEAPNDDLWGALRAALVYEQNREFSVVVDGLEHVQDQRSEFIPAVRSFVEHLQQRFSKVKILLTSRPQADVTEIFEGLPCIEYDKERKECLSYLRFDNTRFGKISKEHEGSCEWLWSHEEYEKWSTSNLSCLLLIQGKPGSGKSTLTKYFHDNLLERDPTAKSAIVASFFYSYREGELQRNHSNMLRSILYDILHQDETFFYHRFQAEYRSRSRRGLRVDWDYESLKTVLKSLRDHSLARRLYLIIDAVDESEKNDRRDILDLLLELCSETKFCIAKIFVASRPVGLLGDRNQFHNITMQDHTKIDISCFADSFLNRLNRKRFLGQARTYIVENAEGVFLWVELVGKELLTWDWYGYPESDIIEFLRCLPKDLDDFYTLMFKRINTNKENAQSLQNLQDRRNFRDLQDGVKMFRFVLWTRRPLTVDELRHALGIPDDPDSIISDESFQIRIPPEHRIISCGGNFLEIKRRHGNGTVQVMHQTVREFFLNPDGVVSKSGFLNPDGLVTKSEFETCEKAAHICISIICIRYLMLCAVHTAPAGTLRCKFWVSEHFERYAQLLNERPLANYALCYLKDHIDGSHRDAMLLRIISQFLHELADGPAVYLLESWVRSHLNETLISDEQGGAADFRNKALLAAVRKDCVTAAEVLLAAGADVNVKDQKGRTPLSWAAEQGNEAIARLLVEAGADKEAKDGHGGRGPLHYAAEQGHEAIARLLVEAGADK
ncbi:putative kinesin, partial [Dactylonectria estremocensis]